MKTSPLQRAAAKIGVPFIDIPLQRANSPDRWLNPNTGAGERVEDAVLGFFQKDGWSGYAGEGALILNLIKAMSFSSIAPRHRSIYVEALYARNVAFEEDRFPTEVLLSTLQSADQRRVADNFEVMASSKPVATKHEGMLFTHTTSMLDFFPGLEKWMFTQLLECAGASLLHSIAAKFAQDPYEYRRGWPDLTMWRGKDLRFVEVKAPGDRLQGSQKKIITEFAKPLGLHFSIAGVRETGV